MLDYLQTFDRTIQNGMLKYTLQGDYNIKTGCTAFHYTCNAIVCICYTQSAANTLGISCSFMLTKMFVWQRIKRVPFGHENALIW